MRNSGDAGNVFIFMTTGTQEEKWCNMILENLTSINPIYCSSVDQCISKLKRDDDRD